MKNKKLFAILTLVCFMFTLMPVAAFAADAYVEVDSDDTTVKLANGKADVHVNMTGVAEAPYGYWVYAVGADGSQYSDLTAAGATVVNGYAHFDSSVSAPVITFADAGTYTVYATKDSVAMTTIIFNEDTVRTKAQILALVKDECVKTLDNTVTVKAAATEYAVSFLNEDKEVITSETVGANSGYDVKTVYVKLVNTKDNNAPVVGATVKISTNSSAVSVDKTEVTTNAAGEAKIKVTASTAGTFKIYAEYGAKADAKLTVESGALAPAVITTVNQPLNPRALDEGINKSTVSFVITDANGNAIEDNDVMVKDGNYKVAVVEKPAASAIDADEINLYYVEEDGVWILTGQTWDEEGDYTVKVTLNNGAYAVAKVTVKEFQTPVKLVMTYKQEAVELNGKAVLNKLYYVDANGVEKNMVDKIGDEVVLSANGYAISVFNPENGNFNVKPDEKYVGSNVTVLAVASKYNLVASVDLAVANEAAAVKYASTEADVAVNNTLVANIVDMDGKKVALNADADDYNVEIQYIILDKPANAKVAVSTVNGYETSLNQKGQFKVSFTASEIGTYKVQTVVRYDQSAGVVKYYSGIEEITVGNAGFKDVVVMSVNSNEIVVNADTKTIDAAPIVENNRTFVPFRALAEAFGATVAFDEATQAVTAELNGTTVVMTIGSAEYTVNGVAKTADVAPFINGSRTMVPVRFVAEAFGIKVTPTYDENGATADILFAK